MCAVVGNTKYAMLKQLYIRNFTLIDELDIKFNPGFSVITGETGAGKSIILGALGLLLGNRADAKNIKAGTDKCVVEAHFDLSRYGMQEFFEANDIDYDADDCILHREVNDKGKSRAFINDVPVSLGILKELGNQLVDIHSQHQNLLLNKEDFQLGVVDIIAQDHAQLDKYQQTFDAYRKAEEELASLDRKIAESKENEDFLRFQHDELEKAGLRDGEQEELEQAIEKLSHIEEIKSALFSANNELNGDEQGLVERLRSVANELHGIEGVYPELSEMLQRLDSAYIDLKDIAQEIDSDASNIDFDPQLLDSYNSRLDTIYGLEHKFHVETIGELLAEFDRIGEQLQGIDNSDDLRQEMQAKVAQLLKACTSEAGRLTTLRQKAARAIEKEMHGRLAPLGIPNVRFEVQITEKPLGHSGADRIAFLFSANKSTPMQPVSQVASGGEIARVMLSLKAMISGAVKLPTIIFDEIDTGVSGSVAEKMAQIMQEMGDSNRQVISITHLPQIAAMGRTHYKVIKEETKAGTSSTMTLLNNSQRIDEIAQMLSGSSISQAAIENAKALLKL